LSIVATNAGNTFACEVGSAHLRLWSSRLSYMKSTKSADGEIKFLP